MYAHEVLEYLLRPKKKGLITDLVRTLTEPLKGSVKFHLGDCQHYIDIASKKNYKLGFIDGINMPYPVTWFDWTARGWKYAALCMQLSSTVLYVTPFAYFKERGWILTQIVFFILHGGVTEDNKRVVKQVYPFVSDTEFAEQDDGGCNTKLLPLFLDDSITDREAFGVCGFISRVIDVAVTLLTCKNVQEVSIPPSAKLNKKRVRNKKIPMYTYKVLKVVTPKKVRDNVKSGADMFIGAMPLHLRIGHFKVYTKERPLFGKCSGRFWWPDRVRGDVKNGVIEKEYKVEVRDV